MALPHLVPSNGTVEVQETALSLDAIGRFVCSTWDEATADPEQIDVVVLGAGLYGGYCASKIFEISRMRFQQGLSPQQATLRVLVLEAGPFLVPEHTQNIPNLGLYDPGIFAPVAASSGASFGTRNLVWGLGWRSNQPFVGQAYCVGGKGVFWGGWCPRLQPVNLVEWPTEVRAFLSSVATPDPIGRRPVEHVELATGNILKRDDPLTGYETLEYEMGVAPSDDFVFDPASIAQNDNSRVGLNQALRVLLDKQKANIDPRIVQILPAPIAVQTQSYISGLFALDKYSSVPALTASVRNDHGDGRQTNLRIAVVPFAHVVRLNHATDPDSPIGTRLVNSVTVKYKGDFKTLQLPSHCQVILAMSAIESTRLALESFSLESSGLRAPGEELMGRNFMVHLRADIAFQVERSRLDSFVSTQWPGKKLADLLQLGSLHVQCEGTHGSYQYQLYAATNINGPDSEMYKMVPDLDIQRQIANGFNANMVSFVLRSSGEVKGNRTKSIRDPAADYVDLAGDGDFDSEFNHRRAWVQFKTDNGQDHTSDPIWKDMHDTAHAIARSLANGGQLIYTSVNGRNDFTLPAFRTQQGVGTTFHDAGTLWMGEDPDTSVTDANGHFHHVTNAYCADQAVFPTVGSANPALTGLCLARKVAEDVVRRHGRYTAPPSELAGFTAVPFGAARGWISAPYNGVQLLSNDSIIETQPSGGIGFYYLPDILTDFDLYIEWKAFRSPAFPNSGILLRMPNPQGINFSDQNAFDAFYEQVTEIQIDDLGKNYNRTRNPRAIFGDSRYKTGAVYGVAPATQWAGTVLAPDGPATTERYWNTFQISARGNFIKVKLNGKPVSEATLSNSKRLTGQLGLQFHTGRVQFRNLQLKS